MHLGKFVHSYTGKIIMSLILGIGLATLFRSACKGKQCRIIEAPPIEEITDQTYMFDKECYKFEQSTVKCNYKKNIVKF